jgi:preprotein translocase subunit SecF
MGIQGTDIAKNASDIIILDDNFNSIVNQSINSTMSRTINTSLTMILVLLIMFIFLKI